MKAKFILMLSEAQWPFYPRQSAEGDLGPKTEFMMDLEYGPWVQFTYGGLRDQEGRGENVMFGGDGMIHHDGKVYSDLVIEFIPDEEG